MKVSIYGLGQFGYALLKHLDSNNRGRYQLHAYARNQSVLAYLRTRHRHPYLYELIQISEDIVFDDDSDSLARDADVMILAVKSDAIREVMSKMKPFLKKGVIILNTAKALAEEGCLVSQIVSEVMTDGHYYYSILAGGTIASDLFKQEPLGTDVACCSLDIAESLAKILRSGNLSVYPSTDVIGVEYASAFKNVISILAGIVKGMGFSYGSQTHTISRTAYEVERLVVNELGGQPETFFMNSQCWGNDMWMSCTGKTRNRQFGVLLGQGRTVADALSEMLDQHKEVEGIKTIQVLPHFDTIVRYPFLNFINQFVNQSDTLDHLKELLLTQKYSR
jgi:glycerol-3-phosphate dehydrogenase (NAD(P)+)